MTQRYRILVVGNGMVGQRFVEDLLSLDVDHRCEITVFGEEPRPAYDRVALSAWFEGHSEEHLRIGSAEVRDDPRVTWRFGEKWRPSMQPRSR